MTPIKFTGLSSMFQMTLDFDDALLGLQPPCGELGPIVVNGIQV